MKRDTSSTALAETTPRGSWLPSVFQEDPFFDDTFRGSVFGSSLWPLMRRMDDTFNRLLLASNGGGDQAMAAAAAAAAAAALPRMDISETDKEWLIEAEMPGMKEKDIEVEVRDGVLRLCAHTEKETREGGDNKARAGKDGETGTGTGDGADKRRYYRRERRSEWMERALTLPDNVESDRITCEYRDGILHCHLPKKPGAANGRRIPVVGK